MESVTLGQTNCTVTRLGLGGDPLGGHGWGQFDHQQAIDAVRKAVDSGINFFDTADVYGLGNSEKLLSDALGNERHRFIIASKFGVRYNETTGKTYKDISPKYARQALEGSLKRLRLEMIPLYYVHWSDEKTPIQETVAELDKCRNEGKIAGIGLSNFSAEEILKALEVTTIDAVQVQFSLADRDIALPLFDIVSKYKITLITWGSLAQGLLTGKYDKHCRFDKSDRRSRVTYKNFHGNKFKHNMKVIQCLKEIAGEIQKTPAQIAIRWLLDTQPVGSVLFGAKNTNQVNDNIGAGNWTLSKKHYKILENIVNEKDYILSDVT
jgi:aryl-alcohol dehydrogenase-like predicted oxidoreductase